MSLIPVAHSTTPLNGLGHTSPEYNELVSASPSESNPESFRRIRLEPFLEVEDDADDAGTAGRSLTLGTL